MKIARVASKPSEILQVVNGTLDAKKSDIYQRFDKLLSWADKFRRLGVRANADLPDQAELAYAFGARGIGLCRTEHMFFGEGRIPIVQRMILADNEADRRKALDELLPLQRDDFYGVFKAMHGTPVTIRTIDPPLHEFLPKREDLMVDDRAARGDRARHGQRARREDDAAARASSSSTSSTRCSAIAACASASRIRKSPRCRRARSSRPPAGCTKEGIEGRARDHDSARRPREGAARPEGDRRSRRRRGDEGAGRQGQISGRHDDRGAARRDRPPIRSPRKREFFSFGTNDLTQLTFGFSRDDVGKFLKIYQDKKILEQRSVRLDRRRGRRRAGARSACERGRKTRPDLKIGICGEHGGDPASIHFFHKVGLDYVSASPYRVPVARLAAAQAALVGARSGTERHG